MKRIKWGNILNLILSVYSICMTTFYIYHWFRGDMATYLGMIEFLICLFVIFPFCTQKVIDEIK